MSKTFSRRTLLRSAAGGLAAPVLSLPATLDVTRAQDRAPIRIGFSLGLSGTLAPGGKSALLAREIWREDVNARGGLLGRKVEFVYYDDQSNPGIAPGIYSKLIDVDKADLLYGPWGTNIQSAVTPLVARREILIFGNFVSWANEALKYERYFHLAPLGARQDNFPSGFSRIAKAKGYKKLAIVAADADGTRQMSEGNRAFAQENGFDLVYDQKYPYNTVDFSSILRAISATKPEVVYVASFPNETAAILRAVGEIGISDSVQMFGGGLVGLAFAPLLTSLGEAVNGALTLTTYAPEKTMDFPGIKEFLDRYAKRAAQANADALGYYMGPYNYASGQIIEQAVTKTGTLDNKVLADYLHTNEFDTIVGKVSFGPTGEWSKSRVLQIQFQGVKGKGVDQFRKPGVQVIVDPPELASGELKTPYEAARA